eukprot:gene30776-10006_t
MLAAQPAVVGSGGSGGNSGGDISTAMARSGIGFANRGEPMA